MTRYPIAPQEATAKLISQAVHGRIIYQAMSPARTCWTVYSPAAKLAFDCCPNGVFIRQCDPDTVGHELTSAQVKYAARILERCGI